MKYIIEIPVDAQYIMINGMRERCCYTQTKNVDDLEELNSDYINEHYGELQDEAYQRGLEDGKWKAEDGCTGCKYEGNVGEHLPCEYCMNNFKNQWTAKQKDCIEVGDEVIAPCGKAIVTAFKNDLVFYLYSVGDYGCTELENLTKTGKHYDIASILEAMRK